MKPLLYALLLAWVAGTPVFADSEALQALIPECESCHGPGGLSTDGDVPIIAGQSQALIEKAHEQFKDWARPCSRMSPNQGDGEGVPTSMCEVSQRLDRVMIEAVAAHFAARDFVPARQPFDETQAVAGAALHELYCETCHPQGGSAPGFAGRLAGQWTPYLAHTIEQIKRSEIIVPHIMERKLAAFSTTEIDALLNFWASQQE